MSVTPVSATENHKGDRTAERPYTHEMVVVHRAFRREATLLPELVRGVRDGDTARATRLVEYLAEYTAGLHHHHALEDELVWPLLLTRAAPGPDLVARMLEQHERIDRSLADVEALRAAWERATDREAGADLASALDRHRTVLIQHLDDEESLVLPLVAEHLTVAEWDLVGTRGLETVPRNKLLLALGAILEDATPEERAYFLGKAPLAGRLAWKLIGRCQYAARTRKLRG